MGNFRIAGLIATALVAGGAQTCMAREAGEAAPADTYPARYFDQFHPNSALDMVRRLPGFTFQAGDPTLRGMAESAGNVVIDGKRIADKTFKLEDVLDRIPASQVDRIELIRGGAPGIDMLGQPVVANIIRRAAAGGSAAVTLSNGLYLDGRVTPGITIERSRNSGDGHSLSFSASVSRYVEVNKGDGHRSRTGPDGGPIEQARVKAAAGGTTGYAQAAAELPALGGQLRLNSTVTWTDYRDHQEDLAFLPTHVTTTLDEDLGGIAGGQAGGEIGAHLTRSFGSRLDTETTISGRLGRKSYKSLSQAPGARLSFDEDDRTAEVLGRVQMRYHAAKALTLALDLEGAVNTLDTRSALAFNAFAIPLPNGDAHVTETRGEAGLLATWQASPKLEVQAGMHIEASRISAESEVDQRDSYTFLKPNLHFTWTPAKGHQIRLRAERTAGQLDFANFVAAASLDKGVVSAGNTALRPDSAWLVEAAYDLRTSSRFNLSLTYRHSWLRDVIDRVPVRAPGAARASFDAPGNIGSGSEDLVSIDTTIPLGRLLSKSELKLSAAYRRSSVTDPTTGRERRVSASKPFTLTADFHQDLPRLKAAWGVTLDSGWRTDTYRFNEVDTERASALLTVFIDYNPKPNLSLRLEASDLLGRRYRRLIDFYDGPRGSEPLLYRDDRSLSLGLAIAFKMRRSF
ncbi:MAG: TonB-dependent receptor [Sphingomonas sp.]